jgi:hypothetical protein
MFTKDRRAMRGTLIGYVLHPPVMVEYKNIKLHKETYERLKQHGDMDESFDDLINRILNDWEEESE